MKTYHLKDLLKKEILIIELPRLCDYHASERKLWIKDTQNGEELTVKGSWDVLGKPHEISEDDARELVHQSIHTGLFAHYVKGIPVNTYCYKTATESLLSAIETVIFWENPLGESEPSEPECECDECYEDFEIKHNDFMIAQSRTFDRSRTLIFVKQ